MSYTCKESLSKPNKLLLAQEIWPTLGYLSVLHSISLIFVGMFQNCSLNQKCKYKHVAEDDVTHGWKLYERRIRVCFLMIRGKEQTLKAFRRKTGPRDNGYLLSVARFCLNLKFTFYITLLCQERVSYE